MSLGLIAAALRGASGGTRPRPLPGPPPPAPGGRHSRPGNIVEQPWPFQGDDYEGRHRA